MLRNRHVWRAGLDAVGTFYEERGPEFLETLQLVQEITKQMEGRSHTQAA
jgi:hypothetical protein